MKRNTWLLGLSLILGLLPSLLADGFIIVDRPVPLPPFPPPRPIPPPNPRPPYPWIPVPPPRPYSFAPLEVSFHHVETRVKDQVATTSVDQEFFNPNAQRLEGTYIFPIPKGAQINKFTMEIGGKPVEAELLAADKARQLYEDIVRKMKDPALLEYAGRDVFKARIFPIEPQSRKHITITYTQLLMADSGLVSYLYPLNTEKFSAQPIKEVSLKIEIETQRPLKTIYSPSHSVEIRRHGDKQATIGFEAKAVKPDTDFQLYYATERDEIGLNMMTYKTSPEEGFFLLLAAPGVETKGTKVIAKDIAFVLDTSGSMAGKKLVQAKNALQFCVENLNDADRFEIIRFSTETEPMFGRLLEATEANRARARDFIKDLRATGGTAIDEAMQKALTFRPAHSDRPYIVIFLTDGLPTVGTTDENQIVQHAKKLSLAAEGSGNTRVFCFGIGTDVNTHLLDKIAEETKAFSQYVLAEEDLEVKLSNFYTKIKEPVLTNLKLVFPEAVHPSRLHPGTLPDLFRGEQLTVAGRYSGSANGQLVLEGTINGVPHKFIYDTRFPERATDYEFIPRLWATRRVGYLLDEIRLHGENGELRDEVTDLARKYGIVTPYTAYLIMEDEKERQVPVVAQSLPQLRQDREAQEMTALAWSESLTARSGAGAVGRARYGMALKSADNAPAGLAAGNVEAARSLSSITGPNMAAKPAASATAMRVAQYTQQTRFVQGRNFFQNGNQWLDADVQKMASAKHIRIQFSSPEYFDLLAKKPAVSAWLALGQNVQFVVEGLVYEVYE